MSDDKELKNMTIKLELTDDGKLRVTVEGVCNVVVDKPAVVAVIATPGINLELSKRPQNKL